MQENNVYSNTNVEILLNFLYVDVKFKIIIIIWCSIDSGNPDG